jgi:hypothetical protein
MAKIDIDQKTGQPVEGSAPKPASTNGEARPKFRVAVDWAIDLSIADHGGHCGICSWASVWRNASTDQARAGLGQHIRRKHRDTIVDLYDNQTLSLATTIGDDAPILEADINVDTDELLAVAGISQIDQLDRTDMLAIPEALRSEADLNGDVFYWKRPEEVDHLKSQGARVLELKGSIGDQQPSSEDGILRSRELVCMVIPHELAAQRRAQKDARVTDQLNARAEEIQTKRDEYERKTYDYLRSEKNLDHQQARQVSRALTQRRVREGEPTDIGMSIADHATPGRGQAPQQISSKSY